MTDVQPATSQMVRNKDTLATRSVSVSELGQLGPQWEPISAAEAAAELRRGMDLR